MLLWLQYWYDHCFLSSLALLLSFHGWSRKPLWLSFLVNASSQAVQSCTVRHFYASEYIFLYSSLLEIKLQQTWWFSPSCMIQYIKNTDAEITVLVVCSLFGVYVTSFSWHEMVINHFIFSEYCTHLCSSASSQSEGFPSPFSFPRSVSLFFSSSHLFSLLVLLSAPQLNQQRKQEADLYTHAHAHPLSHTHHLSNINTLFSITVPILNDLMKIRVCVTPVLWSHCPLKLSLLLTVSVYIPVTGWYWVWGIRKGHFQMYS